MKKGEGGPVTTLPRWLLCLCAELIWPSFSSRSRTTGLRRGAHHSDGLKHSHPAGRSLFMRRHEPERTLLSSKWCPVHRVRHDDFRIEYPGIQLGQREDDPVSVRRLRQEIAGHRRSTKILPLRHTGFAKQLLEKDALIRFRFLVVRIHNRELLPRHVLEVGDRENQRRRDRAADLEFRGGGCSLCETRAHARNDQNGRNA